MQNFQAISNAFGIAVGNTSIVPFVGAIIGFLLIFYFELTKKEEWRRQLQERVSSISREKHVMSSEDIIKEKEKRKFKEIEKEVVLDALAVNLLKVIQEVRDSKLNEAEFLVSGILQTLNYLTILFITLFVIV